jgi:hypothetical protein
LSDQRAVEALDPTGDAFRVWDRRKREQTDWREVSVSGFASIRDAESILYRVATLRQILDSLSPEFLRDSEKIQEQYYFEGGDVFRAKQRLFNVLSAATLAVAIYDSYFDPAGLDFVAALEPSISVRILTARPGNLLVSQLRELARLRGDVKARLCHESHDRWIIIDEAVVWHLGASINGIGKKAFMLSRVVDPTEAERVLESFEGWWGKASDII